MIMNQSSNEVAGPDASGLRERIPPKAHPAPDPTPSAAAAESVSETVRALNRREELENEKTYGRTLDGTGEMSRTTSDLRRGGVESTDRPQPQSSVVALPYTGLN
jgi:hypothetical protein